MVWLFDYDLTLYGTEERCVINSLDHRISLFVGTTLAGLMAMNNTDPDDFFDFIHVPDFLIYPKKAPEKLALLQSLRGPRFVFTNGRHDWSEAGMAHMGIDSAIDGVFDLKQLDWVGKPHDSAYVKMEKWLAEKLAGMGIAYPENPKEIVLLEDSLRNLEPAHRRGWTTIFVNPTTDTPNWVDYHIPHLMNLRDIVPTLKKCEMCNVK